MLARPNQDEYAPYYESYLALVPEGDLQQILESQLDDTIALLQNVTEEEANDRYAQGKWSLKEVIGHLADTERIISYRLLRIARGDATPLAGFNEKSYVHSAAFDKQSLQELLDDFRAVRRATLTLFRSLTNEAWVRRGTANNYPATPRSIAYFIAGHELHHRSIIKERYLKR